MVSWLSNFSFGILTNLKQTCPVNLIGDLGSAILYFTIFLKDQEITEIIAESTRMIFVKFSILTKKTEKNMSKHCHGTSKNDFGPFASLFPFEKCTFL